MKYRIITDEHTTKGIYKAYLQRIHTRLFGFIKWYTTEDMIIGEIEYLSACLRLWEQKHNIVDLIDKIERDL